jgi:MEDS: MEthanogen/methylotroph, DcmR Sensory domain
MSPWEKLLEKLEPEGGHLVQFYGTDDRLLTRNLTFYLGEGLKRGEGALVIARAERNEDLVRHLREAGADPEQALRSKRLLFLDAHQTLARFMVDGQPDQRRFERTLEAALGKIEAHEDSGLRAYGEMVGILWKAGQLSAAILLEQFWNRLLSRSSFRLFCAYPIDVFAKDFLPAHVDAILCAHTHLLPTAPNEDLDGAIDRAMDEILGSNVEDLGVLIQADERPAWAAVPRAEGMVFWLKHNMPEQADAIITRARQLCA